MAPNTALVTGASGFLGIELVRQLRQAGVAVVAAVGPAQNELESRRIADLERQQVRIIPCDLRRENPLEQAPDDWDTLFHLAAYVRTEVDSADVHVNDEGTARLLRQISVTNKRVLYTSTIAVADNAPEGRVTPDTICRPQTAYGKTKLAAEAIVSEECSSRSAEYTIIRLPTLYGPGYRPGGMFDVLPKQLAANNPLARLAWPGRMALLAVEDAAQLVFRAAAHASTRGRIFLASSNENPTTWEIAESIAAATSVPCRTIKFPGASAAFLRALLGDWWQAPIVPYALKVSAWRARLLLNGLYCDGTELAQLLEVSFRNWREGFARMYAEDPRQAQRVTPPLNI